MVGNDGRQGETSVLGELRALVPRRPLRYTEALRIAKLQAEWLLDLAGGKEPPVPVEFIGQLPRIEVVFVDDSPVAGSAHWDGHDWIIVVNARKRDPSRRYSTVHELKHLIDHTTRSFLYRGMPRMSAAEQAERAADYFAGCLLMPESWLKTSASQGCRTALQFAERFRVPLSLANKRLHQVGLAPDTADQVTLELLDWPETDLGLDRPNGAET